MSFVVLLGFSKYPLKVKFKRFRFGLNSRLLACAARKSAIVIASKVGNPLSSKLDAALAPPNETSGAMHIALRLLRAGLLASHITTYASSVLAQHAVWIDVFTSGEQECYLADQYFGLPINVSPRKGAITSGHCAVCVERVGRQDMNDGE